MHQLIKRSIYVMIFVPIFPSPAIIPAVYERQTACPRNNAGYGSQVDKETGAGQNTTSMIDTMQDHAPYCSYTKFIDAWGSDMHHLFGLDGRHALITGGAQGLGRMIAEGLLRAGASVTITSRKPDVVQAAAAEMSALGSCTPIAADLSSPQAAIALVEQYRHEIGRCDILVNNAGKSWGGSLGSFPDKAWPDVMTMNVQIPFTLTQALLPLLKASATPDCPSRIVNIGSVAGARVEKLGAYSYTASKAAIHMLTRELAADLAASHITVNALVPGYFPTRMTAHLRENDAVDPQALAHIPLHRFGQADDIAGAIIFLCSRAGSYVTGAQMVVDGGIIGCG